MFVRSQVRAEGAKAKDKSAPAARLSAAVPVMNRVRVVEQEAGRIEKGGEGAQPK